MTILALLHEGVPGRQATLIAESGASRTALTQSLKHVEALGLIERNTCHGHPLRAEYVLTEAGRTVSGIAHRILRLPLVPAESELLRRSWTLPILGTIGSTGEGAYFREILTGLAPITDRALSQSLKSLEAQRWLTRQVVPDNRPPRVLYTPVATGAVIAEQLLVDQARMSR